MRTLSIVTPEELRQADHKAVIVWERYMREVDMRHRRRFAAGSRPCRRSTNISSAITTLCATRSVRSNGRRSIATKGRPPPFRAQVRKLLDLTGEDTIAGLRDRAVLSVGLQVSLRRAEIAALKVGDPHQNRGYDSFRVSGKGGRRGALAINPQTTVRLRAYLEAAGHGADIDGPLFRPLTALENGAQLEDVQKAAGHRDPSTTKLYDRRGYDPEKAASFFATY